MLRGRRVKAADRRGSVDFSPLGKCGGRRFGWRSRLGPYLLSEGNQVESFFFYLMLKLRESHDLGKKLGGRSGGELLT